MITALKYEDSILFHWKGNLTSDSITMKVFTRQESFVKFRIISWDLNNIQNFSQLNVNQSNDSPITLQFQNLQPNTQYFYIFEFYDIENITSEYLMTVYNKEKDYQFTTEFDQPMFSFKTFGLIGQPYTFNFSASGCARSASISKIFLDIYQNTYPQFFFMLGDLHYRDINTDSIDEFDQAYRQVFGSSTQRYLYQQVPIEYQFDDHDFGKNDADGTSPTRNVANLLYWKYVPHGNLHNYLPLYKDEELTKYPQEVKHIDLINEENIGSYRYQIIGRTILITVDLRTFQNLEVLGDQFGNFSNERSILGKQQRQWLLAILDRVIITDWIQAVIFISSVNFHGEIWDVFPNEQLLIADKLQYIQEVLEKQVLIVSSDSHMTAMKNGQNSFIQSLGLKYKYGLQETMCGSLDKSGSCKTQPLTFGPWLGKNHYTNIEIQDTHLRTCIIVRAFEKTSQLFFYNTCDDRLKGLEGKVKCPFDVLMRVVYVIASLLVSFGFLIIIYIIVKKCHKNSMKYSLVMREK
ncbi:unnamed protein product [Paramecium pentaurelia]|uniref:PhoD-like phosphatase metallophosphatase domain-containing protein n=1 Tax=Paramecium pentaurelia TaxID=43138 RepID=A0A8S1U179_9CILI|nr:unnamed protein product [Paramecium pentaurelia]